MDAVYTGNKISQLRKRHNMTQKELAVLVSVTDKAVSKWERGLNFPDLLTLEKLAEVLHSSVVELLGIERHTNEQVVSEIANIANSEKQGLLKVITRRNWLTIIIGILLYCSLIYTDKMLWDRKIYDIRILGKAWWLSIIIGNAFVSVGNANRLLGKQSVFSRLWKSFTRTKIYNSIVSALRKTENIIVRLSHKSPINRIIDRYFENK